MGLVACEDAVNPAVKLFPVSAVFESDMLSSSGRLGESLPRDSKREPDKGMGNFEIVARGSKSFLPCDRTGPFLAFRVIEALPKLGMVIRSRERLEVLSAVDASVNL